MFSGSRFKTLPGQQSIKKSYGIICGRYNLTTQKVEVVLIEKRATFSYVEFILKHQNKYDPRLQYLFDHMTHNEKIDIMSLDYGRMWYRLWMVNPDSVYTPEQLRLSPEKYEKYALCKNNFEKTFLVDKGKRLLELICKSQNSNCLWEIPKGRKNSPQEKDLNCAIREFEEETGISSREYEILDETPIITIVNSTNVRYFNHYYLAILNSPEKNNINWKYKNPKLNYINIHQMSEVSDIGWMDLDKIDLLDHTKKLYEMIKNISKIFRKKYKIKKVTEYNMLANYKSVI